MTDKDQTLPSSDADTPSQSDQAQQPQKIFSLVTATVGNLLGRMPEVKPAMPSVDPSRWILSSFHNLGKSRLGGTADIDDRLLVLPNAMQYMSTLTSRSVDLQNEVSKTFIGLLDGKHYHQAKSLTSSGALVLRSVAKPNPLVTFPNPGDVFDGLLRSVDRVDHPNGISTLMTAFATILKLAISSSRSASSYLNLLPLYGSNKDEENMIRLKDGSGMLSPDCYYEATTLFVSPAVSALLILWNRNHNYIAHRLLQNNEQKRWKEPSTFPSFTVDSLHPELAKQDDEIFKMARLINCCAFKNVIVEDLLKGLLGLPNVGNSAGLDFSKESVTPDGTEGEGRTSGVEFDLLYNWSGMASRTEAEKIENAMGRFFPGKAFASITPSDFKTTMEDYKAAMPQDPRKRGIPGLRRGDDGRFRDNDIAVILQTATETLASAPRGRGIASCMQVMEIMVINQAREWNVCSLNDFRRYLGLKPFKKFEEWSSSPEIVTAAKDLYGEVDNLELYPGLQAEDAMPGSGFRMGYTMTHALLVDTVNSIRSAATLTATELSEWGSQDCVVTSDNGAFGAALPKILLRNLPSNYPSDNVYGLFPFTLPTVVKHTFANTPHLCKLYDWDRPRPRDIKSLETCSAISHVFNNPDLYSTTYGPRLKLLTNEYGFLLGMDNEKLHDEDQIMILYALLPDRAQLSKYARFFAKTSETLLKKKGKDDVNVVEVINATCASWVYQTICGPLLSQGPEEELQALEAETWDKLVDIHNFIFQNTDAEDGWAIRQKAIDASKVLLRQIERQLDAVINTQSSEEGFKDLIVRVYTELRGARIVGRESTSPRGFLARLHKSSGTVGNLNSAFGGFRNVKRLTEFKDLKLRDSDEERSFTERRVVANALGLSVMSSVSFAEVCANAVDFYLAEERYDERSKIIKLALANDPTDNPTIMGYIREAQRLEQSPGLFRVAKEDVVIPQGNGFADIKAAKGDLIFADFAKAHMNTADFPNPEHVICTRKTTSIQGMGLHKCPGISFVDATMPEIFKAIFRLENLRRKSDRSAPPRANAQTRASAARKKASASRPLFLQHEGLIQTTRVWKWKDPRDLPILFLKEMKKFGDAVLIIVAVFLIFCGIIYSCVIMWGNWRLPQPQTEPPLVGACKAPTIFDPYHAITILPGPDGKPIPIEYTYKSRKPHQLTVIDIDKRDTRLAVFIDGHARGLTRDFELDKSVDCGDDWIKCVNMGFSAGVVIVPDGKHTIKIAWAGKDYVNDTEEIEWGVERSRRFLLQRENCS